MGDRERPNGRYFALFHTKRLLSESETTESNSLKLYPYCERQKCNSGSLVLAILYGGTTRAISAAAEFLVDI